MGKLNKLTLSLFEQGYTKENPPAGFRPWNDFDGGWSYSYLQENKIVVKTPCGLYARSRNDECVQNCGVGWLNKLWSFENENPLLLCPYGKRDCKLNNPIIREQTEGDNRCLCFCEAKITDEPYDYEHSVKKIYNEQRKRKQSALSDYVANHDKVCKIHCSYNTQSDTVSYDFRISHCFDCQAKVCPVFGNFGTEKGNLFYDIKITHYKEAQGLLPEEQQTTVIKGKQFFSKSRNLDLCKAIATYYPDCIEEYERNAGSYHTEFFNAKFMNKKFDLEVINIRAEKRVSRDLESDIADIKAGKKVIHQSDINKRNQEIKKEKNAKNLANRIKKLRKLVEAGGYESLTKYDRARIERYLKHKDISQNDLDLWEKNFNLSQAQLSIF